MRETPQTPASSPAPARAKGTPPPIPDMKAPAARREELAVDLVHMESQLAKLRHESQDIHTQTVTKKDEVEAMIRIRQAEIRREEAEATLRRAKLEIEIDQFTAIKAKAEVDAQDAQARREKAETALAAALELKTRKEFEAQHAEAHVAKTNEDLGRLRKDEERLGLGVAALHEEVRQVGGRIEELTEEQRELASRVTRDRTEAESAARQLEELRSQTASLNGAIEQQRQTNATLREQLRASSQELARSNNEEALARARAAAAEVEAEAIRERAFGDASTVKANAARDAEDLRTTLGASAEADAQRIKAEAAAEARRLTDDVRLNAEREIMTLKEQAYETLEGLRAKARDFDRSNNETRVAAEREADRVVVAGRADANRMIAAAREDADRRLQAIEKEMVAARAEADRIRAHARDEGERNIQGAQQQALVVRAEAERMKALTQVEGERHLQTAQNEILAAHLEAERLKAKAIEEGERRLKAAQEQIDAMHAEGERGKVLAREEGERRIQAAQSQAEVTRVEAERFVAAARAEAERFTIAARTEAERIHGVAQQEIAQRNQAAEQALQQTDARIHELTKTAQELDGVIAKRNEEAAARVREIIGDGHVKAQQHIEQGERDRQEKLKAAQLEIDGLLTQAAQKGEQVKSEMLEATRRECEERKTKENRSLAEFQFKEKQKLEHWQKAQEKQFQASRAKLFEQMLGTIVQAIDTEVTDFLATASDTTKLERMSERVRKVVESVIADRYNPASEATKSFLAGDPKLLNRSSAYWKRVGMIGAGVIVAVIIAFAMRGSINSGVVTLARDIQEHKSDGTPFQQAQDTLGRRNKYAPEQTLVFKTNYTDNILHTINFTKVEQDEAYQQRWTVALNRFFIRELDLSDTIVVKVMPIERALTRELVQLQNEISAEAPDEGIARMRAAEERGTAELITLLKGPENFQKFLEFKGKFFSGAL